MDSDTQDELQAIGRPIHHGITVSWLVAVQPDIRLQEGEVITANPDLAELRQETRVQARPVDQLILSYRDVVGVARIQDRREPRTVGIEVTPAAHGEADPDDDLVGLDRDPRTLDDDRRRDVEEGKVADDGEHGGVLPGRLPQTS